MPGALYAGLEALQLCLGPEVSPVVAVRFASADRALAAWRAAGARRLHQPDRAAGLAGRQQPAALQRQRCSHAGADRRHHRRVRSHG
jgi:hypothetical protein